MSENTLLDRLTKNQGIALNNTQQRATEKGVDLSNLPRHIAIIMDGNGRWAQMQDLERSVGHREGYRTLRNILVEASELGISYLTVYGFSAENWRRPAWEVSNLMQLIEEASRNEIHPLYRNNVRVKLAGDLDQLPQNTKDALLDVVEATQRNTGITLIAAISYGGRAEIVHAIRKIIAKGLAPEEVTEEVVQQHLYNPDVPDPDLVIRPAGEFRISNFLLWESAYSEFYATKTLWPDFSLDELLDAILAYQKRIRNFGGLRTFI